MCTYFACHRDRIQSLHEVDLAFRVPYDIHGLRGKDHKIGNGQNVIKMVILDLLSMWSTCHHGLAQ